MNKEGAELILAQTILLGFVVICALFSSGCAGKVKIIRNSEGLLDKLICPFASKCSYEIDKEGGQKLSIDGKFSPLEGFATLGTTVKQ